MRTLILSVVVLFASLAQAQTTRPSRPFVVFDGTSFTGKPSNPLQGMRPVYIAGPSEKVGWEKSTRDYARAAAKAGALLVLDIEHLPLDARKDGAAAQRSMDLLGDIADWAHDEAPHLRVGYYALMPKREYWIPVLYRWAMDRQADPWWRAQLPQYREDYQWWQWGNDRLTYSYRDGVRDEVGLADHVDFVAPSLYTFYNDTQGWRIYAEENLREARRYGKPVIPFIWMEYHDSTALKGQAIPAEFWRLQLKTVRELADGVVIWGGWQRQWDESAPWWVETRKFLEQ